MRKIVSIIMLIFALGSFANAQIKIVDDDYSASMTSAKNYYEQDVSFETIFPKAKLGEQYKSIEMNLDFGLNHLGDTVWCYHENEYGCNYKYSDRMKVCGCGFGVTSDGSNEEIIWVLPVGYYVVTGYIIGRENTAELFSRYFSSEDTTQIFYGYSFNGLDKYSTDIGRTPSIKGLKESILVSNITSLPKEYITFVKLTSIDSINGKHIDFYAVPCNSFFFNVNFYSEIRKEFLNQEILLSNSSRIFMKQNDTNVYRKIDDWAWTPWESFSLGTGVIVEDALTEDKIKLNDSIFKVEDVVVRLDKKKPHLYVVLKGDKTGSFAIRPGSMEYQYTIHYNDENDNSIFYSDYSNYTIPFLKQKLGNYTPPLIAIRKKDLFAIKQHIVDTAAIVQKKKNLDKQKEENARLARQKEWELSRQKRIDERKRDMIVKYGTEMGVLVGEKKVTIGMTQEMCRDAWGRPMNTYRTTTKYGQSEVWCYNYKTRVYFYNGKVVQIDD